MQPTAISDEELRGVFEQIDLDKSGAIDHSELQVGMRMLGIKVSDNSSRKVLKLVDTDGNGTIEWEEFKEFFGRVSDADGIKMLLSKANRRFFEYKARVEGDPSFGKTFAVPPYGPDPKVLDTYHSDQIEDVVWLSDEVFASGSLDGEIKVWNKSGLGPLSKPMQTMHLGSALYCMTSSSDGRQLFAGSDSGHLTAFDAVSGAQTAVCEAGNDGQVYPIFSCSSSDAANVAIGCKSGHAMLFDLTRPQNAVRWRPHQGIVYSLQFAATGPMLCSGSADGTASVIDTRCLDPTNADINQSSGVVARIEEAAASEKVNCVRWRGDRELVTCGDDFCIKRWDLRALGEGPVASFFGHTAPVRSLTVSPDGRFLASGTSAGGTRIWLADEAGLAADMFSKADEKYKKHSGRRQEIVDLIQAGEPHDTAELKEEGKLAQEAHEEMVRLKKTKAEYAALDCTQSVMGLDSPSMTVSSIAWRDLGPDDICLITGAHDQRVRLFNLKASELYHLRPLPA